MKIVLIGNGSVGDSLTEVICKEGHNVTVIDKDAELVSTAVNKYDVFGVVGNGSSTSIQKEAGVPDCDILIAVAPGDEFNLMCCMIAKQLGAKHTIARVRDPEYLDQRSFMYKNLGIDMIVNPEYEAAREAARLIRFPAATKLEKFARGQVEVVDIHIGEGHPMANVALKDFKSKFNTNILICSSVRGEEAIIPDGDYVILEGDNISLAGSRADINDLFVKIGLVGKNIKDIMLIGGGRISTYLMSQLTSGYRFKTIEKDPAVCESLAELFPKAQIIMGDAADPDILDEEGIQKTDACVIMTSDDQTNLIISMLAQSRGVEKVISKLASPTYVKLSDSVGINSTITPQYIVNTRVLRFVRGLANRGENGYKSEIKSLHKIADNKVEALEFDVAEDFDRLGITLKEIKLKKGVLIAAVIRGNNVIYPNGSTTLEIGDSVIVMTTIEKLCDLGDILA